MNETFVTNIQVINSRNITDLKIPLSKSEKKHLIITGKNGTGKTSLLEDINRFLSQVDTGRYQSYLAQTNNLELLELQKSQLLSQPKSATTQTRIGQLVPQITNYKKAIDHFGSTILSYLNPGDLTKKVAAGDYLIAFFNAKRQTDFKVPNGINKINLKKKYTIAEKVNSDFIQYIVNLKADRSFARDDNDNETVIKIDEWFERFENRLKTIFENQNLKLVFDSKNYNYQIIEENKLAFNFNTLSDGYSAIIHIVTELILRMEVHVLKAYDLEGIVLIDELETHLHVDLQKKILPFLTDFFPKIQFIVSTHSPFVLSSVSNAVICDLETSLITNDLSGYSYDALIESYFNSDKYSEEIKQKINLFEVLSSQRKLNEKEKEQLHFLRNYFAHVPKYLSKELLVKLQQIELENLNKKDNGAS
ncbi:MAG: AAA family ATPase [Saprospiraceae bacterium]